MPDMTVMDRRGLISVIRDRVLCDIVPLPVEPTHTYVPTTWPLIWAELRTRCGPVRCVFVIVIAISLWPLDLVWRLFRWFFSRPTVKAVLAAAVLGGFALWFWNWPGLLIACLFVWLFTLFRRNQRERSSTGSAVAAPAATPMSSSESEQEIAERAQREEEERDERLIAEIHSRSQFKHLAGWPWGDPSSYIRTPTSAEVDQARNALHEREAARREHQEALRIQEACDRERAQAREREAREFLSREAERVLKEREERREAETKRPPGLQ
jgi:hypothetical protein